MCLYAFGHYFNSLVLPYVQNMLILNRGLFQHDRGPPNMPHCLSGPLQPPWGVKKPLGILTFDNYLVSGSIGPLDLNQIVETNKTAL
jgi:hypothetical protein